MSITTEINRIKSNVESAYESISAKGGTVPDVKNTDNLSSAIETIEGSIDWSEYIDYELEGGGKKYTEFIKKITAEMIPKAYVKNATSFSNFFNSVKMTDVAYFETPNATNYTQMFQYCSELKTIPQYNTSKATSMKSMFNTCTKLETIPLLDTSNVATIESMFYYCRKIKEIPFFNTQNVTNMYRTFYCCERITNIPQFNTTKVVTMGGMFYGCISLVNIPIFDTTNVTNMSYMFTNCTSLSEESLNNILEICKNAEKITTKTLKYIGLTSAQAEICTTLSNYQDFLDAGWTTGY